MCGIAGYCGNGRNWLKSALISLEHRGPDFQDFLIINNVGFGHTRLSILDLSKSGNQPAISSNYMMTFNGEIYNYQELRSYIYATDDLGKNPTTNDAYSFLGFIEKYGLSTALNRSNGMFAFGLYDQREKTIYCAVDRFGQKPLYYYESNNEFYFASTPAALYNLKSKWQLDNQAIDRYFMLGALMGEDHILKGIKKLCAGQLLSYDIEKKKVNIKQWYNVAEIAEAQDIKPYVFDAIDAVKIADVPVNIFLSGGIDSTIVASRFIGSTAIHLRSHEEPYALAVANKFKLNIKLVDPAEYSIEHILNDFTIKTGEPTMAGAIPWITAKYARQYGKVAVIANGADELFFGYDRIQGDNEPTSSRQNSHLFRGSIYPRNLLNNYRIKHGNKPSSRLTELLTFVQFDINRTLDFASMCHGLEVRSPFLDHRLVEAALSISESKHRQKGNKTLLKAILHNLGFEKSFTDRPKHGFSLSFKPIGYDELKEVAYLWAIKNGYIQLTNNPITGRDQQYLQASALGLYFWYHNHKHIIQ